MRFRPLILGLFGLVMGVPSLALAHTVTTTDGEVLEGEVVSQDEETVVIKTTFDGVKTLPRSKVKLVNTSVPPLRNQLSFRYGLAKDDPKKMWELHKWAKKQGFEDELTQFLERIIELKPKDKRARKMLGHELVDDQWMSPSEKEQYLKEKYEAEMKAKGLVFYKGGWVTPEERDAREKGLMKDGDDWVTEEEYHKRRGEKLIDGKWTKVGFEEGKKYVQDIKAGARLKVKYHWTPHFDIIGDQTKEITERIAKAAEEFYALQRRLLKPQGNDYPEEIGERIQIVIFKKAPSYARFAKWFDETENCEDLVPGWTRSVTRQHSYWWTHPRKAAVAYQFPETDKTFASVVLHNVALILLTRYRINYKYPSVWLREGYAYHLELETYGYTQSFTLGKGGTASGGGTEGPIWANSSKWKAGLLALVNAGNDPPMKRLAKMGTDQFGYVELVKAWSVVDCLIKWDAAKFKQFIDLTKKTDAQGVPVDEKDALKEAYGVSFRQLDEKWRAFVKNGLKHP